jgi:GT2 family glycosyltransferase
VRIVVVTHEAAESIGSCLDSIYASWPSSLAVEVVVVDNASRDGSANLVAARFPNVRVIRSPRRRGFSANVNDGARTSTARHLLILNPDARLVPGTLEAMVDHLDANPRVGAVGPRLFHQDGRPQSSARRFPNLWATLVRRTPLRNLWPNSRLEHRHLMRDVDLRGVETVDWLLGAVLAVRGTAFRQLGGFDENYRLYCEDIDLCWRLRQAGWSVDLMADVSAEHDLGELTRKRFFVRATLWHFRSMLRFLWLHGLEPIALSPS